MHTDYDFAYTHHSNDAIKKYTKHVLDKNVCLTWSVQNISDHLGKTNPISTNMLKYCIFYGYWILWTLNTSTSEQFRRENVS